MPFGSSRNYEVVRVSMLGMASRVLYRYLLSGYLELVFLQTFMRGRKEFMRRACRFWASGHVICHASCPVVGGAVGQGWSLRVQVVHPKRKPFPLSATWQNAMWGLIKACPSLLESFPT